MTTHQIEEMLGITKATLIYYEQEKMIQPNRDKNNYRNYSQNDIDILRLIILLRSMQLSIDEIKLILNEKLSIREALETKQEFIQQQKIELNTVEENIKTYIKRKKVYIVKDNTNLNHNYIHLYINQDKLSFLDTDILADKIKNVDLSICCSKGENGMYYSIHNLYFIDLNIHTKTDSYSFQLMNNDMVNSLLNWIYEKEIAVNDPLNLSRIYMTYTDPVQLNNHISLHFKEWKQKYRLDSPRENYYHIIKESYIDPLNKIKKEEKTTIHKQFKTLIKTFKDKISCIF